MEYNDFFKKQHLLENDRARLEPLTEDHFEKLLPVALHRELWEFTGANVKNEADFKRYFNEAMADKEKKVAYPFAIFDKHTGQYGGCTRYGNISFENKRVEIGWTWYHPSQQRSGLNRNCKFLLLSYGFDILDLNRVELKTSALNLKSQGAMLKLGAVKEGILRRHTINENGVVRDTVYFSFIREEWEEVKRKYFTEFMNSE